KAGPVIKTISIPTGVADAPLPNNFPYPPPAGVNVVNKVLTINVKGENLDAKAKVKVDANLLGGYQYWITGTPDPQSGFCTEMYLSLSDASAYLEGEHTLTLVNSDGQAADVKFPVDPMTIDLIPDVPHGGGAVPVAVTGKNFGEHTRGEWKDAGGTISPI